MSVIHLEKNQKFMRTLANRWIDFYVEEGKATADAWLTDKVHTKYHPHLTKHILEEGLKRGYNFRNNKKER